MAAPVPGDDLTCRNRRAAVPVLSGRIPSRSARWPRMSTREFRLPRSLCCLLRRHPGIGCPLEILEAEQRLWCWLANVRMSGSRRSGFHRFIAWAPWKMTSDEMCTCCPGSQSSCRHRGYTHAESHLPGSIEFCIRRSGLSRSRVLFFGHWGHRKRPPCRARPPLVRD